jgi:glycosyltransferase involved in cell wall biosynthesis
VNKRLIAYLHAIDDPAGRFRIGQYVPYLRQAGWDVSLRPRRPAQPWNTHWNNALLQAAHRRVGTLVRRINRLSDIHAAARFDAVFLNRDLLEGKYVYEERLFQHNPRVVFDFDDAIFLGRKADHIGRICQRAAWVTVGNETLAQFARQFSPRVTVIPTVIDTSLYPEFPDRAPADRGAVRVGWLGSGQSIAQTLYPHVEMLADLQRELGFEFVVVTKPRPKLPQHGLRWSYVEWSPLTETQIASHFDIGIMPLIDEPYQRGKCGCKLLQYMAAGLPAVASPVGVNAEIVGGGERALAASLSAEWRRALAALIDDASLRHTLGRAGQRFVTEHYSVARWFPELLSIIEQVSCQSR